MAIQVAIEGYDSLEQIGVGGMAAVYRARKLSVDKTVAIKVLFPYLATDLSYIERFQREAKAAASIQHENIVNVIDCGESDGAFFIVMEYYDGRTLEQLMKERSGLPPEIAIQILLEVAYGLEAAHALDVVHRDIKPANIIYTNQGGIKIADFGLARKSDSMSMITQHGKVIGTPAYMSPEQAAGDAVGPASDIFSFGVVAYELLGRRKPFEGRTYSEVLDQIQSHEPQPVSIANPLVAPEFERIVAKALAKLESARYASASDLIADLETAMEKNQVPRDRRRLISYARDPDQYDASFAEHTINHCLTRGAFFMQKGNTHLKDAVLEYRRVLFLDPDHDRALSSLARLRKDDPESARIPPIEVKTTPDDATREMSVAAPVRPQPAVSRRRMPKWGYAALAVLAIGGAGSAYWIISSSGMPGDQGNQSALHSGAAVSREPATVDQAMGVTDSLPLPPRENVAGGSRAGKNTMTASSAETANGPLAEPRDTAPPRKVVKETPRLDKPRTETKPRDVSMRETTRVAPDLKKDTVAAPLPELGSLSVFFLGGVGELWVDGKLFSQQPPFEKASIVVGKHRIACRMGADGAKQEFDVEILPGRTTVIEYEIGGKPVVTDD